MKVGIVCENYYPTLGGEQEHILNLRRHLESPRDGSEPIEVRVIVPEVEHDEWRGPVDDAGVIRPARSMNLRAEGTKAQLTVSPRAYFELERVFAREQFDLLHVHAPVDLGLPCWALATYNGPAVGTLHSYFPHTPKRYLLLPWYRWVMSRITRVIAVSEAARAAIARYVKFNATIISNGVDCDAFESGTPDARFTDGMTNILAMGRLEQRNGTDLVIDAFGLLARERPDVRLILAGDGPLRPAYEERARRLPTHVAERVVFLGAVWEDRPGLYAAAHCFALGARWTSFSILLLEALAAGLRVAALPGEGASRAGDHWSLAEMAAAHNAEAFSEAIRRALVPATPAYRASAREMARRHDWSRIVPQIRAVYQEALAARG